MYLHFYFLTVLDLHCCKGFFSSCSKWGLLSSCDCRLLTVLAFLIAEPRFQGVWASVVAAPGLQSTGSIVVRHRLSCSTACHPRGRELNPYFLCWLVDSLPLSHKRSPGVGLFCFEATPHSMWDLTRDSHTGISGTDFLYQRLNLCPLHWEHQVLTTGLPGKPHFQGFWNTIMCHPWTTWMHFINR